MTRGLADVPDSTLERLRDAILSNQLRTPLTRSDLIAFGVRNQLEATAFALEGHSRAACLAIIEAVLAERAKWDRPAPELVWTGPEGTHAAARDTAVVLRELFESARSRVVLAGYSFLNATDVLGPLHATMAMHALEVIFFVDVKQPDLAVADPEARGQAELERFLTDNWPFGAPFPRVYCDRRALRRGPPWCSLHAKCVVVDGERALISSANFTSRAQERNIETGVLIQDPSFSSYLERQWLSLVQDGLVLGLK